MDQILRECKRLKELVRVEMVCEQISHERCYCVSRLAFFRGVCVDRISHERCYFVSRLAFFGGVCVDLNPGRMQHTQRNGA